MREWVRGSGSGSQRVRAPRAQPGYVGVGGHRQPPAPAGREPPTLLGAPGLRRSPGPQPMHTPARTPSPHPDPLWDTPRDTQRHTGLWPATLALGCVHSASQMHILTPSGAHTHSTPGTHTHGHTLFPRGRQHGAHRQAQPALGVHSHPRAPSRHAGRPAGAHTAPLADLDCTEQSAGSLRCSSRRLRVPGPGGTC